MASERCLTLIFVQLVDYIDWSPFFMAWEMRGKYPAILDDAKYGAEARKLFDDAQQLLDTILSEGKLRGVGVYGFWPAASLGDDVVVYEDECRQAEQCTFHFLRQQWERKGQQEFRCLADYVAPADCGRQDYLGAFAVTAGIGAEALAAEFEADHDDYNAILVKALADRLAEAFAEFVHRQARADWGFADEASTTCNDLINEQYRGIRPAPGYPACPDHTEKTNPL